MADDTAGVPQLPAAAYGGPWVAPEARSAAATGEVVPVPAAPPGAGPATLGAAGVAIARADRAGPRRWEGRRADGDGVLDPLGPVGVAGVLVGGFELLRVAFVPLVGLAAALLLPLQLVDLFAGLRAGGADDAAVPGSPVWGLGSTGTGGQGLSWALSMLRVGVLSFLGLTAGVIVADALARRRRHPLAVIGAAAPRWWVAALLPVLCVPPKVVAGVMGGIPFLFVDALLMCASVVAGAEGAGPLRSIARSWLLGWRSYGTALGVAVGGLVVTALLQAVLYLGPVALAGFLVAPESVLVVVQQLALLSLLVTQPLTACIAARAWVELRCRGEALDISRRRHDLGLVV